MRTARRGPVYIEEPTVSRWLFGSSSAAWIWLIARLWLGWEWLHAGWGKVFGGNLTWRVWNWGDPGVGFTGDRNIGWVRSGTAELPDGTTQSRDVGDAVAGFASNAIETGTEGPNPDIAYGWYVDFLEWLRDTGHTVVGPVVAVAELTIGILLILGAFTGVAALLGAVLNFTFVFAGAAGINPAMILVSGLLVLAWRNAGWYGLDRWLLPALGTPWHRGKLAAPGEPSRALPAEREAERGREEQPEEEREAVVVAGGDGRQEREPVAPRTGGERRKSEEAPTAADGWTPEQGERRKTPDRRRRRAPVG